MITASRFSTYNSPCEACVFYVVILFNVGCTPGISGLLMPVHVIVWYLATTLMIENETFGRGAVYHDIHIAQTLQNANEKNQTSNPVLTSQRPSER